MDNRSWLSGASATPPVAPSSPSVGYPTGGNPSTSTPPTNPGPYWPHAVGEELRAVIVAGGLTPNAAVLNQLLLALNARYALAGGAMATVLSTAGVPYGFQIGPLIVQFVKQYIGNPAGPGITFYTQTLVSNFPTACIMVIPSYKDANASNPVWVSYRSETVSGFQWIVNERDAAVEDMTLTAVVIGY